MADSACIAEFPSSIQSAQLPTYRLPVTFVAHGSSGRTATLARRLAASAAIRQVIGGQASAALSQLFGVVQLALLLRTAGATRATDTYFVLFSFGQAPISILVVGFLYPWRLAERADHHHWGGLALKMGGLGAAAVSLGALFLVAAGEPWQMVLRTSLPLALSSSFAVTVAVYGVAFACQGYAFGLSGLAVLPNAAACLGLVMFRNNPLSAMLWALVLGNILALAIYKTRWNRLTPLTTFIDAGAPSRQLTWLFGGAVVGYGGQVAIQSAAVAMPAGTATAFAVIWRVAAGIVVVGLNGALPAVINWRAFDTARIRILVASLVALGSLVLAACTAAKGWMPNMGTLSIAILPIIVGWLVLASVNAVVTQTVQRLAMFGAYRATVALTAPTYAVGVYLAISRQTALFLAVTMLVASIESAVVMCWYIGWRRDELRELALVAVGAACGGLSSLHLSPLAEVLDAAAAVSALCRIPALLAKARAET